MNATLHGSALASASGAPSFFDSFSKYVKMHWFYKYFGCPDWATFDYPRECQNSQNECHAAWERFPKMQNERHAAWERFAKMKNEPHAAWERIFCPYGPGWSPQKDPPKTPQTICFNMFLKFFGAPLEHPSCAHQKMDHPKWSPKSSQGNHTKQSFSGHILHILLFGIHLVAAPSVPFIWKISKKTLFL